MMTRTLGAVAREVQGHAGRRRRSRSARSRPTAARCRRVRCSSRSRAIASTATTSCATRTRRAPQARSCRGSPSSPLPQIEVRDTRRAFGARGTRLARDVRDPGRRSHGQQRQDHGQGARRRDPGREPLGLRDAGQHEQRHRRAADADATLTDEHDALVVELGANHAGEIDYLASLAQPTVASSRTRRRRISRASARSRASRPRRASCSTTCRAPALPC